MVTTTELEPSTGLRSALRAAAPLLAGVGLLMAGNGLTSTLIGVRGGIEGFGASVTGLVLAGYYVGFLAGSLLTPSTIRRVGHVRVFAGLASLASATVLVHVVWPEPASWLLLRAVSGLCISGLYIVTETWLNGAATNATRGGLLGGYMVVVTGGMLAGQALFAVADPAGFTPFVLASVLVSLAVVAVALTPVTAPTMPDPVPLSVRGLVEVAPLGAVGAALSGFTAAAVVGGGAVYAAEAGFSRGDTAALIAAALAGGLLLQVPLGRWSDRTDRRIVISAGSLGAAAFAVAAATAGPDRLLPLLLLTAVGGGAAFPLYSLSVAHLNDYLEEGRVVAAGARMVLLNGAGAIAGPVLGAAAVGQAGPGGLFVVLAAAYVAVGVYAAYRMTRRAAAPEDDRSRYVPFPFGTSPAAATLVEGAGDELYPTTIGFIESHGSPVPYREQGTGEPVVLVHGAGEDGAVWRDALGPLAADGARAVAPDLAWASSTEGELVDDLLGVLRQLELPSAAFVGRGAATGLVARFARDHPDRVEAVILTGAEARPGDAGSEVGQPVLRLDRHHLLEDEPDAFADAVVTFLRGH